MVFLQGTYMAQNFISKTSTILYSITKGISKIYQLEKSNGSLKFFIYSFIFIHSLMREIIKMYL